MGPVALITGCIWTFLLHPFSVPTTLLGTFLFTLLVLTRSPLLACIYPSSELVHARCLLF